MRAPLSAIEASQSAPAVCAHVGSALLHVAGDDAVAFLHGQLSSDVKSLEPSRGQYWSYNSPKGRVLANGVLWRSGANAPPRLMLVVAADLAETMRRRLAMFVLRAKVTIEDTRERYALLGLAGPHTADIAHDALGITVSPLAAVSFKEYGLQDANTLEATQSMVESRVIDEFLLCDQEVLIRHLHKETAAWVEDYQRKTAGV